MYSSFCLYLVIICASYLSVSGSLFVLAIYLSLGHCASYLSRGNKQMVSVPGSKCIPVVCHMRV